MERVEQMKRNIVIVAVIVPLLLAAWVLAGPEKALAQSVAAAEDQYSTAAAEDQYSTTATEPPMPPGLYEDTGSQTVPPDPSLAPSQDHSQQTQPPLPPGVSSVPPDPSQNPTPDQGVDVPDQDHSQIPPQADTEAADTGEQASSGIVEQINGVVEQINGLIASLTDSSGTEGTQQPQQPQQVLQQMPEATPAPQAAQPLEADMGSTTDQMTDLLVQDIDPFWAQRFQGWAAYNSPNQVWYDQPTQTPCGMITPEEAGVGNGHNYCSANETIYMSTPAAQAYAANWGNFANVYQLAHEQGHHVQKEMGYFEKYKNDTIPGNSRAFENQADCFAGVWANSAYGQSKIGTGQIQEAIAAAEGLADDRTIEEGATHGNTADRTGWFMQGFNSGDPSTCAT